MWCCMEMAGPEGQTLSAGAAIKGFSRVAEAVWRQLVENIDPPIEVGSDAVDEEPEKHTINTWLMDAYLTILPLNI